MRSKKENTEEKQDQIKTHLHNENTINRDEEEMVKNGRRFILLNKSCGAAR